MARLAALKRRQTRRQRALARKMLHLARCPLTECWIESSWYDARNTRLIIVRQRGDGQLAAIDCELDLDCLGLRHGEIMLDLSPTQIGALRTERFERPVDCFPAFAAKLFFRAIEFASRAGFEPHASFFSINAFLSTIDPRDVRATVSCGQDGKPVLRPRVGDDVEAITRKLRDALGEPPAWSIEREVMAEAMGGVRSLSCASNEGERGV